MQPARKLKQKKIRPTFLEDPKLYNFLGLGYYSAREIAQFIIFGIVGAVFLFAFIWLFCAFLYAIS